MWPLECQKWTNIYDISVYKYFKNTISYSIGVLILYIVLIIYNLIKCGMLVKEKHNIYICMLRGYCAYSNKIDLSIQ